MSMSMEMEMEQQGMVEGLGDLVMSIILSKLDAQDAATVSCVNRRFRVWASDDSIWSLHCSRDLHLSSPGDPSGNPASSFKVAYQLWREAFDMYPWPLVKRVKTCWDRLKGWLVANFPEVLSTLRRGASEDELNDFEKSLRIKLPLASRVIYRFCDGQELSSDKLLGLIGGYSVYDHHVNVSLLPLKQAVLVTKAIVHHLGFSSTPNLKYIAVAASTTEKEKIFFLNCADSQLYVGTSYLREEEEMMPCVPDGLLSSTQSNSGDQQQDGMLLWLEEHGCRLKNGIIGLREEDNMKSINQFPEKPPLCSTAVTNGVQVRASAVLVPELSEAQNPEEKFFFAYSIRMSLLPEGCTVHGTTFNSCQLYWRRWIIRENENVVKDVNGEAVIGKYPLLRPGEKEFVYESCTPLRTAPGSIEGSFIFVPGRLMEPKGDPFEVEVTRFPLERPDYIF